MHDYDLNTFGLWFGAGLLLIVGGLNQSGWKHRWLVTGMIGTGGVFIAAAVLWPWLWPSLAGFMSRAATPSTWLVMALLVAAYLLLGPQFKRQRAPVSKHIGGVGLAENIPSTDPIEKQIHDLAVELRGVRNGSAQQWSETTKRMDSLLQAQENRLKGEISGAVNHINQTRADIAKLRGDLATLSERSQFPQNLGQTVGDAFEEVQAALRSQIDRGVGEANTLVQPYKGIPYDVLHLLEFATVLSTIYLLTNLVEHSPWEPMQEQDIDAEKEAQIEAFVMRVRSAFAQNYRASEITNVLLSAEGDVERSLSGKLPSEWPLDVSPAIYRRRMIAGAQLESLVKYLERQKALLIESAGGKRSILAELLTKRQSGP